MNRKLNQLAHWFFTGWLLSCLFAILSPVSLNAQTPASPPPDATANSNASTDEPESPTDVFDRSNPRETMQLFLLAMENIDDAHNDQIARALDCLDLSKISEKTRQSKGLELAKKLAEIIEIKGVTLDNIPSEPTAEPFTFYGKDGIHEGNKGTIRLSRMSDGLWQFDRTTVASIEAICDALKQQEKEAAETQTPDEVAEDVPQTLKSPRAMLETFFTAMNDNRIEDAVTCLDLSEISPVVRDEQGSRLAARLFFCVNRMKFFVAGEVPADPAADSPYHWFTDEQLWKQHDVGRISLHRVQDGDHAGQWLITPATLTQLEELHKLVKDRPLVKGLTQTTVEAEAQALTLADWMREQVPDSMRETFAFLEYWQWIGLCALLIISVVFDQLTILLLAAIANRQFHKGSVEIDRQERRSGVRPMGLLVVAAVWYWGLILLSLDDKALLLGGVKFFATFAAVWSFYRMVDLLASYLLARAAKTPNKFDDLLIPMIRKSLKIFITLFGIVFIADTMDWNLKTMLAGLGIGGLAFAFAAKETLGNIFGSLTILLDRPFHIGDWINIKGMDGTVESVGLRSTRIRTFYNSIISIPNADCVNNAIDNYGRRTYRRIKCMISVLYSTTPEQLEAFTEGIRQLIRQHPYTRKNYFHVYVNDFAPSSIDILLYCFVRTPDWATELREKHRLFIDIIRLAHKLGVEFAFPTQTIHLSKDGDTIPSPLSPKLGDIEGALQLGREQAETILNNTLGEDRPIPPPVTFP